MSEEIVFRKEILKKKKFDELLADDPTFMLRHFDEIVKRKKTFFGHVKILDIGAGPCIFGYYCSIKSKACSVISLDVSIDALRASDSLFGFREGRICGDSLRLPCRSEAFNVVFCSAFLHHLQEITPVLFECRRVLKDGGKIIAINEPCAPPFILTEIIYKRLFGKAKKRKGITEKPRTSSEYVKAFSKVFGNVNLDIDRFKTERNIQKHGFLWRLCYRALRKSYFTVAPFAVIITATKHM
ncbi:MAG: class I SAM-dependent methyltransferase [Candidatus Bathyarchaeota archaeon]|nr:class I SAM-dependent methyltransferase [Candidatus Bathyarchaeota archaeon]